MVKSDLAQFMGGAIMLLLLGAFVLVGKKTRLSANHPVIANQFRAKPERQNIVTNHFGSVIYRGKNLESNAIIEHIALHVPKNNHSEDKIIRYGRLVSYPNAQATILMCHGFMCDKFDIGFLRHMFEPGRCNIMTFDFRAHGENCYGQRCTFGRDEALDVATAAQFLKHYELLKGKPIIAYGFSMGAVAAIEAQAAFHNSLFQAMILDCPFDSTENIIKRSLENLQFTFLGYDFSMPACCLLQKYAFHPYVQAMIKGVLRAIGNLETKDIDVRMYPISPVTSITRVNVPCFFIHCKNDEKIPANAVRAIFESANTSYKVWLLTNGRRHFDSYFYDPERYMREVRGFVNQVITGSVYIREVRKIVEDTDELLVQI